MMGRKHNPVATPSDENIQLIDTQPSEPDVTMLDAVSGDSQSIDIEAY
jgi:hypothetical protein